MGRKEREKRGEDSENRDSIKKQSPLKGFYH